MDFINVKELKLPIEDLLPLILDVIPKAKYAELRIEDDGQVLVIAFVEPEMFEHEYAEPEDVPGKRAEMADEEKSPNLPADEQETHPTTDEPSLPLETQPAARSEADWGENEKKAHALCDNKAFRMFMSVETREEAIDKIVEWTRARDFALLDKKAERYKRDAFRDLNVAFENWLKGDD